MILDPTSLARWSFRTCPTFLDRGYYTQMTQSSGGFQLDQCPTDRNQASRLMLGVEMHVQKYQDLHRLSRNRPSVKRILSFESFLWNKRKWRYFDSGDENFHLEGHAVKSPPKNQRKRCYVCGDVQHTGKKCRKRRTCYFCNERGHVAEDCPKSSQEYNICLRCGESGHDLFSCNNDYPPNDLKNIVCYICNKGGHICCHTCTNISPDTVSCYNCGESGHSGVQCPKPHMDKKSSLPPSLCYKCGEEGHAARKCGVPVQKKHQQSEG